MAQTAEQHPTELSNSGHFANLRIMKQELEAQVADFGKSLTLLEELPKKLSHKIQAPINKVCFVEGKIVRTNEVFVKIGDYLIQKSTFDASKTFNNKISTANSQIDMLNKILGTGEQERSTAGLPIIREEPIDGLNPDEMNIVETLEESVGYDARLTAGLEDQADGPPQRTVQDLEKDCMFMFDSGEFLERNPKAPDVKKTETVVVKKKVKFPEEVIKKEVKKEQKSVEEDVITTENAYTRTGDANISINNITPGEQNIAHLQKMIDRTSSWGVSTKSNQKKDLERLELEDKEQKAAIEAKNRADLENQQEKKPKSLFRQRMENN